MILGRSIKPCKKIITKLVQNGSILSHSTSFVFSEVWLFLSSSMLLLVPVNNNYISKFTKTKYHWL